MYGAAPLAANSFASRFDGGVAVEVRARDFFMVPDELRVLAIDNEERVFPVTGESRIVQVDK